MTEYVQSYKALLLSNSMRKLSKWLEDAYKIAMAGNLRI